MEARHSQMISLNRIPPQINHYRINQSFHHPISSSSVKDSWWNLTHKQLATRIDSVTAFEVESEVG
eukprot:5018877-Prorocentrum_lima.AAC.1